MAKIYNWEGFQGSEAKSGIMEAESESKLSDILSRQNIMVTSITETESSKNKSNESEKALLKKYSPKKIQNKDKVLFTKKLATMVRSGLPILKTLRMLEDQAENPHMKVVATQIRTEVEGGQSLSEAFGAHKGVFDTVYINLMKAGETSGKLNVFLDKLVIHLEKIEKIRRKVKGALMYPCILLTVAFCVILLMLIKVVPVFQKMFSNMGHALPAPTQLIVNISEFMREPAKGGMLILIIFGIFWLFKRMLKSNENFKKWFDRRLLKTPLVGDVIIKSTLSKIAMISANLSAAGVSIIEALSIISKSVNNTVFLEAFEEIKKGVAEGKQLSALFAEHPVFPPTFYQMISVGEETGRLDDMLLAVANYYEEEFDLVVDRLTELLEPIMIVFMGITVGFIIVAMYMPIFQIGDVVSKG